MLKQVIFCLAGQKQEESLIEQKEMKALLAELREKGILVECSPDSSKLYLAEECLWITDQPEVIPIARGQGAVCVAYVPEQSLFQSFSQADLIVEGFEEVDVRFLEQTWCHAKGEPCVIAEGERVLLKELTPETVPELYRIYHQPEVRMWVSEMTGSLKEECQRMSDYQKYAYPFYGFGIWGIYRKEDGKLLGSCGLEQKEWEDGSHLELGYVVDRSFWGEGIASEAASLALQVGRKLGAETIWAKIETGNDRSKAVARGLGMKFTGLWEEQGKSYELYQIGEAKAPI